MPDIKRRIARRRLLRSTPTPVAWPDMALTRRIVLHEATVKSAGRHVAAFDPPPGRAAETRPRTGQVTTRRVAHPLVWAAALQAAAGDVSRLDVVNYETVIVR